MTRFRWTQDHLDLYVATARDIGCDEDVIAELVADVEIVEREERPPRVRSRPLPPALAPPRRLGLRAARLEWHSNAITFMAKGGRT